MEPVTVAIILIIIGLVLMIIEATAPGGYLVIPGLDLLVIGIYGCIFPDMLFTWTTVLVAVILSIPVIIGTTMLYRKLGGTEPPSTTVTGSLVGRTGKVVVDVVPGTLKGKVKIASDTWSADADEPIPSGTEVVVESSEGVHVHVKRL